MKDKAVRKLALQWLKRLDIPEGAIRVAIGDKEWREMGNRARLSPHLGRVMDNGDGFGLAHYRTFPRERIANAIVHEIAHILWPSRPHWWVECFAARLAPPCKDGPAGRYSRRYCHDVFELPSRAECIRMARKRAKGLFGSGPSHQEAPGDDFGARVVVDDLGFWV